MLLFLFVIWPWHVRLSLHQENPHSILLILNSKLESLEQWDYGIKGGEPGPYFSVKVIFPGIGISIIKTRQPWHCIHNWKSNKCGGISIIHIKNFESVLSLWWYINSIIDKSASFCCDGLHHFINTYMIQLQIFFVYSLITACLVQSSLSKACSILLICNWKLESLVKWGYRIKLNECVPHFYIKFIIPGIEISIIKKRWSLGCLYNGKLKTDATEPLYWHSQCPIIMLIHMISMPMYEIP